MNNSNEKETIQEQLEEILEKYNKVIEKTSQEFIKVLEINSKTYGEVYRKLDLLEKEIMYSNLKTREQKRIDTQFFFYIKNILDKKKNDLPLTNRSK